MGHKQIHINPLRVFNNDYKEFKKGDFIITEMKFDIQEMKPLLFCQVVGGNEFTLDITSPDDNKIASDFLIYTDVVDNQSSNNLQNN